MCIKVLYSTFFCIFFSLLSSFPFTNVLPVRLITHQTCHFFAFIAPFSHMHCVALLAPRWHRVGQPNRSNHNLEQEQVRTHSALSLCLKIINSFRCRNQCDVLRCSVVVLKNIWRQQSISFAIKTLLVVESSRKFLESAVSLIWWLYSSVLHPLLIDKLH